MGIKKFQPSWVVFCLWLCAGEGEVRGGGVDLLLPGPGLSGAWKHETRENPRGAWNESQWYHIEEDKKELAVRQIRFAGVPFNLFPTGAFSGIKKTDKSLTFTVRVLRNGSFPYRLRYTLRRTGEHELEGTIIVVEAPPAWMLPRTTAVRMTRIPDGRTLRLDLSRLRARMEAEAAVKQTQGKLITQQLAALQGNDSAAAAGQRAFLMARLTVIRQHLELLGENVREIQEALDRAP